MTTWDLTILTDIAHSDDLHISPLRADGVTYGTPTWIWSVVVDGKLYVRAYNGVNSRWFQAAMEQRAGRIIAGGHTCDVRFSLADAAMTSAIDDAYRAKYADSQYLPPMVSERTQAATVLIEPSDEA